MVKSERPGTGAELTRIVGQVAAAPFAPELLAVDAPLWGGFWQGDVIGPGYQLPAVELALLRAIRLDENWPAETTVPRFLAELRRAILEPGAGLWTLAVAEQPAVVLAGPGPQGWLTVVWYCAATGCLHAGYRTAPGEFQVKGAITQREPGLKAPPEPEPQAGKSGWLAQAVTRPEPAAGSSLVARLDLEILQLRAETG